MIIVAGIARSGLTVTMQMLNAGGYPCLGKYPAFEPFTLGSIPWGICDGMAVKLVDAQLQIPPIRKYRIIRLSRDMKEQAKSTNKLIGAMGFPSVPRPLLIKSFKKDYAVIDKWVSENDFLKICFEEIVTDPAGSAQKIAEWVGVDLDIEKMANCVIDRSPGCHPKLLELAMV